MGLTDRYVTDAGQGSGDGTFGNDMSFATFIDYMVTGGSFTAAPGDRFNIKGAITARTTTQDTWVNGGTATSPVIVRGYNSSIGDLTSLARTNGNGPIVTTNYPTITYTTGNIVVSGNFIIIEALSVTSGQTGASQGTFNITGTDNAMKRCVVVNSATNANSCAVRVSGVRSVIVDNDISMTGASGGLAAVSNGATGRIIANRIKGGTAVGIRCGSNNQIDVVAFNTIFTSGTGALVAVTGTSGVVSIMNNTLVGGGGDGINIVTGNTGLQFISGNMITDNTGDGIDMVSTANAAFTSNIRTRDNANAYANSGDWITATNYDAVTTDTGGPETDYVAAASNDYRLISASPAVGVGNPLYLEIGALQRLQTASGGGIRTAGHGGLAA